MVGSRFPFLADRGFDLDAQELPGVFDDKIVAAAISPRFADGESMLGGASHEAQFCPLSPLFVLFDTCSSNFHEYLSQQ